MKELEWNSFDEYPHYVYATAFLVNGELADYRIKNDWPLGNFAVLAPARSCEGPYPCWHQARQAMRKLHQDQDTKGEPGDRHTDAA